MVNDELVRKAVLVCKVDELKDGEVTRVNVVPPIAVYNIDGQYYATSDLCSHDKSSLSEEGYVADGQIECGWHFARFCIKTGAVKSPPASQPLISYEVSVVGDELFVNV